MTFPSVAVENMCDELELVPVVRRARESLDGALHAMRSMRSRMQHLITILDDLSTRVTELSQSIALRDTRARELIGQTRRGIKRPSEEPAENECPKKMQKNSDDHDDEDLAADVNDGELNRTLTISDDGPVAAPGEPSRPLVNINANMDKSTIHANLNEWLSQVYNQTTKFYTVKKWSHIGTFVVYVAIDINLDETKDDIHVVVNSEHLRRPNEIFQFVENCFQERKVVTLLHIVTDDARQLRCCPDIVEDIIKTMMQPIVVHL